MEKIGAGIETTGEQVEETFVVVIPKWRHHKQRCWEAKEKELRSWEDFNVYKEVKYEGQDLIGTTWMLIEKVIEDKLDMKA